MINSLFTAMSHLNETTCRCASARIKSRRQEKLNKEEANLFRRIHLLVAARNLLRLLTAARSGELGTE